MYGAIVLTENTSVEFKIIIKIQNDIRVYGTGYVSTFRIDM